MREEKKGVRCGELTASSRSASQLALRGSQMTECSCTVAVSTSPLAQCFVGLQHDQPGRAKAGASGTHCQVSAAASRAETLETVKSLHVPQTTLPENPGLQGKGRRSLVQASKCSKVASFHLQHSLSYTKGRGGRCGAAGSHRKRRSAAWAVFTVSISSRETTVGGPGFITYHFELALHLT